MIDRYVGEKVFVRTVTHHYTGKLTAADEQWLVLHDAAWIADDGRFADFLAPAIPLKSSPTPTSV